MKEITAMKLEELGQCRVEAVDPEAGGVMVIRSALQVIDALAPVVRELFAVDIKAGAVTAVETEPDGYGEQLSM